MFSLFLTDAYSYHIWGACYNGSYSMMATKPIRALVLYHPMIQFLIIAVIELTDIWFM